MNNTKWIQVFRTKPMRSLRPHRFVKQKKYENGYYLIFDDLKSRHDATS